MSKLEDKIIMNKSQFDVREPSDAHFESFQEKLDELHPQLTGTRFRFSMIYKIAAAILVLVVISSLFIFLPSGKQNQVMAAELPQEIQDAKMFYDQKADAKLKEIESSSSSEEQAAELKKIATEELKEIDKQNEELTEEYKKNPNNENVEKALIGGYKSKSDLLDKFLSRLKRL